MSRSAVIESRWAAIREKILANASFLGTQGAMNSKVARGRTVYWVRFRFSQEGCVTQKSIYIGDNPDLVARTRQLLGELRDAATWPRQVRAYSDLVAGLIVVMKRQGLTA